MANAAAALLSTLWLPINERGLMVIVLTISSILGLLAGLGIGNIYRGRRPRYVGIERLLLAQKYTLTASVLVVLSAVAGGVACWLMSFVIDEALSQGDLIIASGLSTAVQVALLLVTEARFAQAHFVRGSAWAAGAAAAGLVGLVIANRVDSTAAALTFGQAGASGIVLAFAAGAAIRTGALRWAGVPLAGMWMLVRDGVRSLGLPLGIVIMSRADRLILGMVVSPSAVAIYALAATLAEVLRLVPTAVGQITTQQVAEGSTWKAVVRVQRVTIFATLVGGLMVLVVSIWAVPMIFSESYSSVPGLLAVLLVSEICYSPLLIANRGLIGGEWSTVASRIGVVAVLIALPVYFVFSATLGAVGCAIARILIVGGTAVVTGLALRRKLN